MKLRALMLDPSLDGDDRALDPKIGKDKLEKLWRQMASIMLQLYSLRLPRIGSPAEDSEGGINVNGRPLTRNMSNLVQQRGILPCLLPLPEKTYEAADS